LTLLALSSGGAKVPAAGKRALEEADRAFTHTEVFAG
jgi:hypothetical protein